MKGGPAAFGFLAACGMVHGFQAAPPPKGSIEGQVVNLKGGTPLKKASVSRPLRQRSRPTATTSPSVGVALSASQRTLSSLTMVATSMPCPAGPPVSDVLSGRKAWTSTAPSRRAAATVAAVRSQRRRRYTEVSGKLVFPR